MKKNHIILLSVIVVGIIVFLSVMPAGNEGRDTLAEKAELFPNLVNELGAIEQVKINKSSLAEPLSVAFVDGHWVLQNKNNYFADKEKVNRLLYDLAHARLVEAKTKKADFYHRLGVEDVDQAGSQSSLVELLDQDGKNRSVILGETAVGWNGQYVRKHQDPQSWVTDKTFDLGEAEIDWLDKLVLKQDSKEVHRVISTAAGAKPLTVVKRSKQDPHFEVADLAADQQLKSEREADRLAKAIANLTLEDVAPKTVENSDSAPIHETKFIRFDGMVMVAELFQRDEATYLSLKAELDESVLEKFALPEADPASDDDADSNIDVEASSTEPKVDLDAISAEVRSQVDAFNLRHGSWLYRISDFAAENFTLTLEDLLKSETA